MMLPYPKLFITSLYLTLIKVNDFLKIILTQQCDAISVLEKEHDYRDEHFDFIQSHIRKFCLQCILFLVDQCNVLYLFICFF